MPIRESDTEFVPDLPPLEDRRSIFEEAEREAHRHKWIESEKAGRDLGYEAIRDWHNTYWRTFCRERWCEHVQGEIFWTELDNGDFGLLNYKFHHNTNLVREITDRLKASAENLDIVQWAVDNDIDTSDVIQILNILDINARRLAPAVDIDDDTFVAEVKARHHARALVVDDDPDTRQMLRELFDAEDLDCVTVASGEEALEEVLSRRFDMFLIDIMLPGKHGAEVAWYLKRHGVQAPIIAISAVMEHWNEDDLYDCGFTQLMPKPFDMGAIRRVAIQVKEEIG